MVAHARKKFNGSVDYGRFSADLRHLGIAIQGCFVFGLDHDTPNVFDATTQSAIDHGIDLPLFAVLTPFPDGDLLQPVAGTSSFVRAAWDPRQDCGPGDVLR